MIRVEPAPEPEDFDPQVRQPGRSWLLDHPEGIPPSYWRRCSQQMADAYHDRCAWSAMRLNCPGTIDHFISLAENRALAYEWSNFRYAAGWLNSSKQDLLSHQILDPFEVKDEWFELILPSLQVVVTNACPPELREKAEFTLKRLHLRDGEQVIRFRRKWLEEYEQGRASLELLDDWVPLLARALRRR